MFGKKKKGGLIRELEETRYVVNDFSLRGPYWGYRNCEYTPDPSYSEGVMIPVLDAHISKLCSGGIDAGNRDVLEQLIFGGALKAAKYQQKRHVNHMDNNCQFVIRRKTDIADFKGILEEDLREEQELVKELENIDRLLARDKAAGGESDE